MILISLNNNKVGVWMMYNKSFTLICKSVMIQLNNRKLSSIYEIYLNYNILVSDITFII